MAPMAVFEGNTGASAQLAPESASRWWEYGGRTLRLPLGFATGGARMDGVLPQQQNLGGVIAATFGRVAGSGGELRDSPPPGHSDDTRNDRQLMIASVIGVTLAIAITFSERVREALYPNIVMFQLITKVARAPLFIVWLGVGSQSCVTFGVFIAFFPVVVSTVAGWSARARKLYGSAVH